MDELSIAQFNSLLEKYRATIIECETIRQQNYEYFHRLQEMKAEQSRLLEELSIQSQVNKAGGIT